jgi:hypothetical protein
MPVDDDGREAKDAPGPWQHLVIWKTKGDGRDPRPSHDNELSRSPVSCRRQSSLGTSTVVPCCSHTVLAFELKDKNWCRSEPTAPPRQRNPQVFSMWDCVSAHRAPPSSWQVWEPSLSGSHETPAPTWRAAVEEEGQSCGQAEARQETHGSWGKSSVNSPCAEPASADLRGLSTNRKAGVEPDLG